MALAGRQDEMAKYFKHNNEFSIINSLSDYVG